MEYQGYFCSCVDPLNVCLHRFGGRKLSICSTNRTKLRLQQSSTRAPVRAKAKVRLVFYNLKMTNKEVFLSFLNSLSSHCWISLLLCLKLQQREQGWCHQTELPALCPCPQHESRTLIRLMLQLTCSYQESPCP